MVFATGLSIHWVRTNMLEAAVGILTLAHLIPHTKLLEDTITLNFRNPLDLAFGFPGILLSFGLPLAFALLSI
jgi:hypothetical protein